ncbi:MAG: SDR family NAD(P)-dependent oxidoreductase [Myxococcales bacterium]|nr:SDR family NAD(P)-dependent oxidoreductase [Myxococcales bacterium]
MVVHGNATANLARALRGHLHQEVLLHHEDAPPSALPSRPLAAYVDLSDLGGLHCPDRSSCPDLIDRRRAGAAGWPARLALLRQVLTAHRGAPLRVLHATAGLQAPPGVTQSLAGARQAGLIRALGAEHPQLLARTVDLDFGPDLGPDLGSDLGPDLGPAAGPDLGPHRGPHRGPDLGLGRLPASARGVDRLAAQLADELRRGGESTEICRRGGARYAPHLEPAALPAAELRLDPRKVYLVTGGTRGLGARIAERLVERGARHLALTGAALGSSGADPAQPLLRALEQRGAQVTLYRGELTDAAALASFLAEARARGELGGIVHCAGRLRERPASFLDSRPDAWHAALGPKVDGLEVLAALCADDAPDFAVLFSSVAGVFPALAAGALEYACANAFLSWFAAQKRRAGKLAFRAVAWPSWLDEADPRPLAPAYARLGLEGLPTEAGLRLFERIAAAPALDEDLVICPGLDAAAATSALAPAARAPLTPPRTAPAASAAPAAPARPAACQGAVPTGVPCWLTAVLADTLGAQPSAIHADVPFAELGLDSIRLTELLHKLEAHLRRPLDPTLLVQHTTLGELAAALPSVPLPAPRSPAPGSDESDESDGNPDAPDEPGDEPDDEPDELRAAPEAPERDLSVPDYPDVLDDNSGAAGYPDGADDFPGDLPDDGPATTTDLTTAPARLRPPRRRPPRLRPPRPAPVAGAPQP